MLRSTDDLPDQLNLVTVNQQSILRCTPTLDIHSAHTGGKIASCPMQLTVGATPSCLLVRTTTYSFHVQRI